MNMQDWVPSGKVSAAGIAGMAVFLAILIANQYVGFFAGNPIDGPLASGLPVLAALLAAYFRPPTTGDVGKVTFEKAGD